MSRNVKYQNVNKLAPQKKTNKQKQNKKQNKMKQTIKQGSSELCDWFGKDAGMKISQF